VLQRSVKRGLGVQRLGCAWLPAKTEWDAAPGEARTPAAKASSTDRMLAPATRVGENLPSPLVQGNLKRILRGLKP